MISIPVAAHSKLFWPQLDLFWFAHRQVYGHAASSKVHAIVMKRNDFWQTKVERMQWPLDIPHTMCEAFFDRPPTLADVSLMWLKLGMILPLNIQVGLEQILPEFDDEDVLEVLDCDMLHFRTAPPIEVGDNELIVSAVYEKWHLHSLDTNRYVIEPYFENGGEYYNGGFVPIIGKAKTFRKILYEWTAVHIHILSQSHHNELIHWWAGMFALQAACEKKQVRMVDRNYCYIPGANELADTQYIGHYAIDSVFSKRTYPNVDASAFDLTNPYYALIKKWLGANETPPEISPVVDNNLDMIGRRYGSDKSSLHHDYLFFYERFLSPLRDSSLTIFEIGVYKGASLHMWKDYFQRGLIVGIDINPDALEQRSDRISIEIMDQSNVLDLIDLARRAGPFELVVDDGSHMWNHQITSFNALFPFVKSGGYYIVEDLDTSYGSYVKDFRGIATQSTASYLQQLCDYVVGDSALNLSVEPNSFFRSFAPAIKTMTFHRRTCVIEKR